VKRNLPAAFLLAGGLALGAVSVGIEIGPPPAPRVLAVPASPGPGYTWVGGYWYPVSGRYAWHDGYWTRPPYVGATWVGPMHDGRYFHEGYWTGPHGRIEHNHAWDHDRDRDYRH
jgi:hypothetical protein